MPFLVLDIRVITEPQAPRERHWYVADENDLYCRACNLPRVNRRHAERPDMVA